MNILEIVLNEPLNPNGPPTYRVGLKGVIAIEATTMQGGLGLLQVFVVHFDSGYMRTVTAHGLQSVLYDNPPRVDNTVAFDDQGGYIVPKGKKP